MDILPKELVRHILGFLEYKDINSLYLSHKLFWVLNDRDYSHYINYTKGDSKLFIKGLYVVQIINSDCGFNTRMEYMFFNNYSAAVANYKELCKSCDKHFMNQITSFGPSDTTTIKLFYENNLLIYTQSSDSSIIKKLYNYTPIPSGIISNLPLYAVRGKFFYDCQEFLGIYDDEKLAKKEYKNYSKHMDEYTNKIIYCMIDQNNNIITIESSVNQHSLDYNDRHKPRDSYYLSDNLPDD